MEVIWAFVDPWAKKTIIIAVEEEREYNNASMDQRLGHVFVSLYANRMSSIFLYTVAACTAAEAATFHILKSYTLIDLIWVL